MPIQRLSQMPDTWVFDLDNTLYPASCNLFPSMDVKMSAYIAEFLNIPVPDAKQIQHTYYLKYGTTLAGLMRHHNAEPEPFLDFVHDVDLTPLDDVLDLGAALDALEGRKLVYTNGSQKHAKRITQYLGIDGHFDAMYGIDDADYLPKPELAAYQRFCATHNVDPATAVFFEDLAVNLAPAKKLGFATVLIGEASAEKAGWIDHITPCLHSFLEAHTNA